MKKSKFLVGAALAVTVSTSLLSFASANESTKKDKIQSLKVVDNTVNKLQEDANLGWALAWSDTHDGILAWNPETPAPTPTTPTKPTQGLN